MTVTPLEVLHRIRSAEKAKRSAPAPYLFDSRTITPTGGRHRTGRGRAFHAIDLENQLMGNVRADRVRAWWSTYQRTIGVRWDDHLYVALAQRNTPAFLDLPGTGIKRLIGANGPDGADHALIDAIDAQWIAQRYTHFYLVSDDKIFTTIAREVHTAGVRVIHVHAPDRQHHPTRPAPFHDNINIRHIAA